MGVLSLFIICGGLVAAQLARSGGPIALERLSSIVLEDENLALAGSKVALARISQASREAYDQGKDYALKTVTAITTLVRGSHNGPRAPGAKPSVS